MFATGGPAEELNLASIEIDLRVKTGSALDM